MSERKDFIVKIPYSRLEKIARYYQFPVAAFLTDNIPKGTRKRCWNKRLEAFEKIKEICLTE